MTASDASNPAVLLPQASESCPVCGGKLIQGPRRVGFRVCVKCEVGVTSRIDDAVCRETYDQKYALGIIGANSNRSESRLLHRLRERTA